MFFIHCLVIDLIVGSAIYFDQVRIQFDKFKHFGMLCLILIFLCLYISTKTEFASRKCVSITNYFSLTIFFSIFLFSSATDINAVDSLGVLIVHVIFTTTILAIWTFSKKVRISLDFIGKPISNFQFSDLFRCFQIYFRVPLRATDPDQHFD